MKHTIPFLIPVDETFDIGSDTRTTINDDYKAPFIFNGKINKLTFRLGQMKLSDAENMNMKKAVAVAND